MSEGEPQEFDYDLNNLNDRVRDDASNRLEKPEVPEEELLSEIPDGSSAHQSTSLGFEPTSIRFPKDFRNEVADSTVDAEDQILRQIDAEEFDAVKSELLNKTSMLWAYSETENETVAQIDELVRQMVLARRIMGPENVFGPAEAYKAFGVKLSPTELAKIPLSITTAEVEREKELGNKLVFRVDHTAGNRPLTMDKIYNLLMQDFPQRGESKKVDGWLSEIGFFDPDVPRAGWAFVSGKMIPESISWTGFYQQMEFIEEYLKDKVFEGQNLPEPYKQALAEYESRKIEIEEFRTGKRYNSEKMCDMLVSLQINQLCRPSPVEVLYDLLLQYSRTGKEMLATSYILTNKRANITKDSVIEVGGFRKNEHHLIIQPTHWSFATGHTGIYYNRSL